MKPAVLVTMQLPPAAMSRPEQHAAVTTVLDQSDPRFAGTNAANPAAWPNGDTWTMQLSDLINYMASKGL